MFGDVQPVLFPCLPVLLGPVEKRVAWAAYQDYAKNKVFCLEPRAHARLILWQLALQIMQQAVVISGFLQGKKRKLEFAALCAGISLACMHRLAGGDICSLPIHDLPVLTANLKMRMIGLGCFSVLTSGKANIRNA